MFTIRHSKPSDLSEIHATYAKARELMRATGNPTQWGTTRPAPQIIEMDVQNMSSYVVINESNEICAVFAYWPQYDDPTYHIIDGQWLNDEPYAVIHRIASNGKSHGILQSILAFVEKGNRNIRIDTHQNNKIMQHLLNKNGYIHCGTIITDDGTPRLAFMKTNV